MNITDALAYLTSLHEGATKRPWKPNLVRTGAYSPSGQPYYTHAPGTPLVQHNTLADQDLIAVSRNVLPELLAVVRTSLGIGIRGSDEFNPEVVAYYNALADLAEAVAKERDGSDTRKKRK